MKNWITRALAGGNPQGSWHETWLLVLDAGKWVLEVLAEPNECEAIQAGNCRTG